MTDYSKLSDTQIAEKVAGEMGLEGALIKGNHNVDLLFDFMELLKLPTPVKDAVPHPYHREALPFLFFGWPAPLMMAKVKERLICDGHSPRIRYNLFAKTWSATFEYRDDLITPKKASAATEPRALYEAFLQVMEEPNETT